MTFAERAGELAVESSVAVMILSNPECTDVELMPLRPRPMTDIERARLAARWHGRDLDSLCVIGLVGVIPRVVLKRPVDPEKVAALSDAFLAYVHSLLGDSFAAQIEAAEVEELERMYLLPDTRPN